jgi:hypothetical protein
MADARLGSGPAARARRIVVTAVGVNGAVINRRESLVVWALIREAESWARERGLIVVVMEGFAASPSVRASVDWSRARRAESVRMVDFNVARSCSPFFAEPGILVVVPWVLFFFHVVLRCGGENI